jgi:hypothetical protein
MMRKDVENIQNIMRLISLIKNRAYIDTSVIFDGSTDYRIYLNEDNKLSLLFEISNFERIQREMIDYLTPINSNFSDDYKYFISKKTRKIYIYDEDESGSYNYKPYYHLHHGFIPVRPLFEPLNWGEMITKTSQYNSMMMQEEEI